MRIAVLSPFVDRRHGTERSLAEILEGLAERHGHEIHLYSQHVADLPVMPFNNRDDRFPPPHLLASRSVLTCASSARFSLLDFCQLAPAGSVTVGFIIFTSTLSSPRHQRH